MLGFLNSLPGAAAQGVIWGIMAIGVYITYKILDVADLTVDGTLGTGGAVMFICLFNGMPIAPALLCAFLAGCIAGLVTGALHTLFGIPAILTGILTQLSLYSINLRILSGKSNVPLSMNKYDLLVSLRNIPKSLIIVSIIALCLIALLYWFFGTELGHSLRATGSNPAMARANGINTNSKNFALRLVGVVLGGIIYYVVITFVLRLGLNANDLKMLSAVVVAIFLAIPYWKTKWSENRPKPVKEDK